MLWVIGQLGYNGTKIIDSLKQHAFNTSIGTVLRAFCSGVAAFVTNPKYLQVPGTKESVEGGLQMQDATTNDKGTNWTGLQKDSELSLGTTGLGLKV